jgi:hypothetical protein
MPQILPRNRFSGGKGEQSWGADVHAGDEISIAAELYDLTISERREWYLLLDAKA